MFSWITSNLIWTESLWLALGLIALSVAGFIFWRPLLWIGLALFLFCFYFFRNPERICLESLADPNVIVCPADGTIVDIAHDPKGASNGYHYKISIFLSPLNVHVNWTPLGGTIKKIEYVPGKFMMAFLPKSSELNEHNDVIIRTANGKEILVRQIAGTVARRIVCWLKNNQAVHAGQKYGMIKFSSRVDLFLPDMVQLNLKVGQKVFGGQTVIGRFT